MQGNKQGVLPGDGNTRTDSGKVLGQETDGCKGTADLDKREKDKDRRAKVGTQKFMYM